MSYDTYEISLKTTVVINATPTMAAAFERKDLHPFVQEMGELSHDGRTITLDPAKALTTAYSRPYRCYSEASVLDLLDWLDRQTVTADVERTQAGARWTEPRTITADASCFLNYGPVNPGFRQDYMSHLQRIGHGHRFERAAAHWYVPTPMPSPTLDAIINNR